MCGWMVNGKMKRGLWNFKAGRDLKGYEFIMIFAPKGLISAATSEGVDCRKLPGRAGRRET